MRYDLFSNIKKMVGLNIQTIATDTTTVGNIVDLKNWGSCVVGIDMGTLTDGDYVLLLEDGDNASLTDAAVVTDANLRGTEAGASFTADSDDDKTSKLGYIGKKRYVRMSIVSTSTSSGAVLGGYVLLGNPIVGPDTTQTR